MAVVGCVGAGELPALPVRAVRPARRPATRPVAGGRPRQRLRLRAHRHLRPRRRHPLHRPHRPLQARLLRARSETGLRRRRSLQPMLIAIEPAGRKEKGTAVRGSTAWDQTMESARGQAERYLRALPASEGNPPFVVVVDVGHTIELYADFSRLGKTYTGGPAPPRRTTSASRGASTGTAPVPRPSAQRLSVRISVRPSDTTPPAEYADHVT